MNTTTPKPHHSQRLGALNLVACLLLQTVAAPALAGVSQLPGLFITPPLANVMFTLDDSLSMLSDAIPDFVSTDANAFNGMPNADNGNAGANAVSAYAIAPAPRARFPAMWKSGSNYWGTEFYRKANAIARYMRSSAGNPLYYDPKVTYTPWPKAGDETPHDDADPTAVNIHAADPFNTGFRRNIAARVNVDPLVIGDVEASNFWPATYFVYKGSSTLPYATPNSPLNVETNFTKVEIKPLVLTYARDAGRTDCTGPVGPAGCSYAKELQNFANWLQYYHTRMLMAKGGVAGAFAKQLDNLRVGFGTINSANTVRQGVAKFSGARRSAFYTDLYGIPPAPGGTPLRRAMDDVGKYFQRSDVGNPWAENPTSTTTVGTEYTCRRSFHILSTDGYWNGAGASASAAANNDSYSGRTPKKPDGNDYAYSNTGSGADPLVGRFTVDPFKDGNGDTLADVAAYYWKTDLRPTLLNEVPSSIRDPAFWQHLTTYTIGFGISGSGKVKRSSTNSAIVPTTEPAIYDFRGKPWLDNQETRDWLITNKIALNWGTAPTAESLETGDDLVHASMNGRGKYFAAGDAKALRIGLSAALGEAADNPSSLANVVTQSPQVSAGSAVFQATYNPAQWSGRFYAFPQAADGSVVTTPSGALWEASNKMPTPANRNIFTWDPLTKGTTFTWLNLSLSQQVAIGADPTFVDWLRGSDANEAANGGGFRDRARYTVGGVTGGVLGDVVNGSPIKGPSAGGGYQKLPTGSPGQGTYTAYRSITNTGLDAMRSTIFLGANDGMLHAFNIATGVERFAYVPNSVYSVPRSPTGTEQKLRMLAEPGYQHRYTVDGAPQVGDAFIGPAGTEDWKTVLVSSTGAGARSVFAMDVSNTVVGSTGFGAGKLLWEFAEADNADMGYVIGYPHIARMRDGTWVSIFGNGYDSTSGLAKLFIVNLQTGAVLWEQSVGTAGGNGLSQPNFIVNANREVTQIYAGDLQGNLWKFDVDSADRSEWKVAFGSAPAYAPLYTGSTNRPITVMPELTLHPNGGTMVTYGTGELFKTEDTETTLPSNINLNTQALYGIWDKPGAATGFSGSTLLVAQGMNGSLAAAADATTNVTGTTSNTIDWGTKRGWTLNLGSGDGVRVNVNPRQINTVLLVISNKPNVDPCKSGGTSRLFVLDPISGGAPGFAVLDSNGVGGVTSADKGYNVKSFAFGVMSLPTLQSKKSVSDVVTTEKSGTRGQTAARDGGVEGRTPTPTDCSQWLLAGGSNTSIAGLDIATCNAGNPRISWRQIK